MNDWRSKPRTGRHQFFKCLTEIKSRIENGETQKMIFDSLKEKNMNLGYSQFNRYVRKYILHQEIKKQDYFQVNKYLKKEPQEGKNTSPSISKDVSLSWNSINVTREGLIERLHLAGLEPSDVKSWGLASETQISKKLTEILIKRGNQ